MLNYVFRPSFPVSFSGFDDDFDDRDVIVEPTLDPAMAAVVPVTVTPQAEGAVIDSEDAAATKMEICAYISWAGLHLPIRAKQTDTVEELKASIGPQDGELPAEYKLFRKVGDAKEELEEGRTLQECGIEEADFIIVVKRRQYTAFKRYSEQL